MKKLLFLTAALMLASAGSSFANGTNNCTGGLCGQGASNVGPAQGQAQGQGQLQGQQQGQGQAQGQQLNNQNKLNNHQSQNAVGVGVGIGGGGGGGGAGGQGGAGGSVAGGNVKSTNSNQNSNANSNTNANTNNNSATGGASYSGGNTNSQSTTFQAAAYAPDAISNAPGFGISVGIGVCAGQESHSGGGGVGVGIMGGPSIGVSGEYGDATMVENHQCDYRAHANIFCNMPRGLLVKGKYPAGFICDSILSKLDGAGDAMSEWDNAHNPPAPKVATVAAPVQTATATPTSSRPARCGFESPNSSWAKANCN